MLLVSACLLGVNCKYNQKNNWQPALWKKLEGQPLISFCPERAGGLTTPRLPCEIVGGHGQEVWEGQARVLNCAGQDVTSAFLLGAQNSLKLAEKHKITEAVLKSRSPSCGVNTIYDGTFSHQLRCGDGVCAALLRAHGITVISDEDFIQ